MSSDRARITYDPARQYRSVVMQQGRVTLEADWNEAQEIADEAIRADALDFVGPAGTSDNGYEVSLPGSPTIPAFDFNVGQGTMYVGGDRVSLPNPITYFHQSDWLDGPAPVGPAPPKNEFVYLLLCEQEVSAVEDPDLLEVALGGPDTAQRIRFLQRVTRLATRATDCAGALTEAETEWATDGLMFDGKTMRLHSQATLQVRLQPQQSQPDPCAPTAQNGYLGAENHLIRVQVTAYDPVTKAVSFVWSFDNASFLYRVEIAPDRKTLTLKSRPVDEFHQPKANQAVEVLRSAAQLSNGQFLAAHTGFVATLQADYDQDSQQVVLNTALPPPAYDPAHQTPPTAPFFLRIWEAQITTTAGKAETLGHTGLQVTLQTPGGAPFHVGDCWMFAARPRTPQRVYPDRYLNTPQPPEGPRLWACPLAVIAWQNRSSGKVVDCRNPFDNLVELSKRRASGCCTVVVRPEDTLRLQEILDRFQSSDPAQQQVNICFLPGQYPLPRPLRLGTRHSQFTLEACHDGVVIQAQAGQEASFLDGLIVLNHANNVTLRGLRFDLPLVPFLKAGGKLANMDSTAVSSLLGTLLRDLNVSIGLRPVHCARLTVQDCLFRFTLAPEQDVFGAGIFAGSACWGIKIAGNRFVREQDFLGVRERPFRLLAGYLLAPSATFTSGANPTPAGSAPAGTLVPSLLQDAAFDDNLFTGLTAAALIYAGAEAVAFRSNSVRDCYAGFWLLSLGSLTPAALMDEALVPNAALAVAQGLRNTLLAVLHDPALLISGALARSYPLPPEFDISQAIQVAARASRVATDPASAEVQALFDQALAAFGSAPAPARGPGGKGRVRVGEGVPTGVDEAFARGTPLSRYSALNLILSAFERQALALGTKQGLRLALHLTDNEIDALVEGAPSGIAVLVWDDTREANSAFIMSANRLQNQTPDLPTVLILMTERNAITGNLILNAEKKPSGAAGVFGGGGSLFFSPGANGALSAVTGNVLMGPSNLGSLVRPNFTSPLNTWLFANAES